MSKGAFPFLRATFYRWAQLWPELRPDLARTAEVLAIGDLHVENFGTWRDSEGRLIWGINDFDEACPMPYTNDLVRLATSARLAIQDKDEQLSCDPDRACEAILEGYRESIQEGGGPFVLAEHNRWLRNLAQSKPRSPAVFWRKLRKAEPLRRSAPLRVNRAFIADLPEPNLSPRYVHREAGVGSLGRERSTLVCEWNGSMIAREGKPLVLSAWFWAHGKLKNSKIWYKTIIDQAVRAPDPFLTFCNGWVLRRLAPDSSRIELKDLPKLRDELRLLRAVGWETGNIHLGNRAVMSQVRRDLTQRGRLWLSKAAAEMEEGTITEWRKWRRHWKRLAKA